MTNALATKLKEKPTYKIFLLDDDDFDNLHKDLPYMKKKKLEESLGFANPKTNEAYVRKTGVQEIDDSTIEHELQELLVKISPDEEDGIRYKSGGKLGGILGPIIGAILTPFIGPAGIAIGAGISGGTRAHTQSKKPEKYGKPTFGSIAGATAKGAIGSYLGGKAVTGGMAGTSAAKAAGKGFLGQVGGAAKGALVGTPAVSGVGVGGTVAGAAPAGVSTFTPATKGLLGLGGSLLGGGTAASKATQTAWAKGTPMVGFSAAPSIMAATGPYTGNPLTASKRFSKQTPSIISQGTLEQGRKMTAPMVTGAGAGAGAEVGKTLIQRTGDFIKKPMNLLGGALMGGSMLPKTPQFEFPSEFTDLQAKLQEGGALSPLGEQARVELSSILSAKPTELYPEANQEFLDATFRRLDEGYTRSKEALDARYNTAGVFGSGEHLAAQDELQQNYANIKADTTAQINQRNFELGMTQKYRAVQDSLGVDKNDMDNLLGLTGISVDMAAQIYNVKAADVEELRKSLGTLGSELLLRGEGLAQSTGTTINIGGGTFG